MENVMLKLSNIMSILPYILFVANGMMLITIVVLMREMASARETASITVRSANDAASWFGDSTFYIKHYCEKYTSLHEYVQQVFPNYIERIEEKAGKLTALETANNQDIKALGNQLVAKDERDLERQREIEELKASNAELKASNAEVCAKLDEYDHVSQRKEEGLKMAIAQLDKHARETREQNANFLKGLHHRYQEVKELRRQIVMEQDTRNDNEPRLQRNISQREPTHWPANVPTHTPEVMRFGAHEEARADENEHDSGWQVPSKKQVWKARGPVKLLHRNNSLDSHTPVTFTVNVPTGMHKEQTEAARLSKERDDKKRSLEKKLKAAKYHWQKARQLDRENNKALAALPSAENKRTAPGAPKTTVAKPPAAKPAASTSLAATAKPVTTAEPAKVTPNDKPLVAKLAMSTPSATAAKPSAETAKPTESTPVTVNKAGQMGNPIDLTDDSDASNTNSPSNMVKTATLKPTAVYNEQHQTMIDANKFPFTYDAHGKGLNCLTESMAAGMVLMGGGCPDGGIELQAALAEGVIEVKKAATRYSHGIDGKRMNRQTDAITTHNATLIMTMASRMGKIAGNGMSSADDVLVAANIIANLEQDWSFSVIDVNADAQSTIFTFNNSILFNMLYVSDNCSVIITNGGHFSLPFNLDMLRAEPPFQVPTAKDIKAAVDATIRIIEAATNQIRALPDAINYMEKADIARREACMKFTKAVANPSDASAWEAWAEADDAASKWEDEYKKHNEVGRSGPDSIRMYERYLVIRRVRDIAAIDRMLDLNPAHKLRHNKSEFEHAFECRSKLFNALLKDFDNDEKKLNKAIGEAARTAMETAKSA